MRVLVSGASGLIGTELRTQLGASGHTVARLVRREPRGSTEFRWDPAALSMDAAALDGVDAVINLSGASLARLPWTAGYRREILDSRVQATRTLTDAMRRRTTPPSVLLNASAVGIYGNRPHEVLTEDSAPGSDFLAKVVSVWESEASRAPEQTRVVTFRTGLVIARGGALKPLLPLAKVGLAGPLGKGTQGWPWVSLHDEAAAIVHLLTSPLSGPVNVVGPTPATANAVIRAVADALHRPFLLPVPEFVLTLALQDAARQLLLADQQVSASRLERDGFVFAHRTVAEAVAAMLRRP
ncbi:TIGR01777 family protein [Cryobacterium sp. TMT1-21]|uniref:TIGR01777 family protein n=1 Tax=Cryobacterium shii TaxID=1259235 RepID=A0AAQ2C4U5_9MICO|nr:MULTISPECIES: TIGR01777 family oxidoreductase [Cryobacterium]TFC43830.1 TIGR01777 family protein [Cryobacterium shii]TFC80639.1 TIGR01777 family protein [Cryobacterium sp. TmT2-59]TFD14023.1 TIGR01777 family protein [Cryobacterium sp. TMT1-21]TFD17137.1 TIGR01777 family protein [Cryobacterium sp. TMT4-10]TFD23222.1 TIGR01777 family protein [Cryobacterium sp. TMT2-23]